MHHQRLARTGAAAGLLLLLLLLPAPAAGQTLEQKVKEIKLDNGMTFLVVERHEAPVVLGAIVFNVGAANEWPNVTGISHLLEHMMFKGSKEIGTKDFAKEIPFMQETDKLGDQTIRLRQEMGEWRFAIFKEFGKQVAANFTEEEKKAVGTDKSKQNQLMVEKIRAMKPLPDELAKRPYLVEDDGVNYLDKYLEYETAWGEIARLLNEQRQYIVKDELWETYMNNGSRFLNAGTSNDFTVYFAYLPANRLELWMDLESDRMDTPIFREFWSERDVVMEERRLSENDPDSVLSEAFFSVAFTASPYKWPVVGWMSDLQTIDPKELETYHRRYYAPNNATAVVVGDISATQVEAMAKRYFGSIPGQEQPPRVETREPEQKGERRVVVEHTANPMLMIGWHKPTYPEPDAVTFQVLQNVLGGGRTSRLYKTVYEKKQLTAQPPSVYAGPGQRYENLFIIQAEPRHPNTLEDVEKAIYEEVELLKKEPVSDRELERIKNQIDAGRIRQMGSNIGIAFQLALGQVFMGDWRFMFRYYDRIKEVTAAEVQAAAQKYLTVKNRTVGYRVKTEAPAAPGEESAEDKAAMQQAIMAYLQSLPQDAQMAIIQKFQQLRGNPEEMKAYGRQLYEQAKAAGFGQEAPKEPAKAPETPEKPKSE